MRKINDLCEKALIGPPHTLAQRLRLLARKNKIDEIVILTWAYDPQDRYRSYELLARELIE